jgi:hypothetical protein
MDMAKGQQRSSKEQRKPKSADKKQSQKPLRPHELIQQSRTTGSAQPPKK